MVRMARNVMAVGSLRQSRQGLALPEIANALARMVPDVQAEGIDRGDEFNCVPRGM